MVHLNDGRLLLDAIQRVRDLPDAFPASKNIPKGVSNTTKKMPKPLLIVFFAALFNIKE